MLLIVYKVQLHAAYLIGTHKKDRGRIVKKLLKNFTREVKNTWAFATFLAELVSPVLLAIMAFGQDGPLRIAIAVVASIMATNALVKLWRAGQQ